MLVKSNNLLILMLGGGAGKMAQGIKAPATKPGNLRPIPRTRTVKGED